MAIGKAWTRWAGMAAGGLLASAAGAEGLRRLPADFALPQGDGSPGQVTFSHASHVDERQPSCLSCHPRTFAILQKGKAVGLEQVKHEAMEKGQACGACHGKQAFGLDACQSCHKG